jgi:hypothetical protein
MATPDSKHNESEQPSRASSRFKITKEGIESEQSVPGEHTPGLLTSVVLTVCAVMAVVAPAVTLKGAVVSMSPTWTAMIIWLQEAVILSVAIVWVLRRR